MIDVTLAVAFFAGIVSFLSPCVLPIIPGFLSYLAGTSTESTSTKDRFAIFINSIFFVLGFSLVFAILGVLLNTVLEQVAYDVSIWLSRIGGLVIIFFGLYLTGLIHVSFLEREHKAFAGKKFKSRYVTSLVFGAAFAAGWTPCVGAALGAILGLAASNPAAAFWLLMSYSIGLGVPFLLVGLFASQAQVLVARYSHVIKYINILFGFILVILGVMVFTQTLSQVANFDLVNKLLL